MARDTRPGAQSDSRPDSRTDSWPGSWGVPARLMAGAVEDAVEAARDAQPERLDDALAVLVRLDREQLATALGSAVTELLERAHPDGLDAEGAEQVLHRTVLASRPWFPRLDEGLLLRALTGALGLGEHPDAPRVDADAVLAHGVLLLAELTRITGVSPHEAVAGAMAELQRAQTVEMP